MKTYLKTTKQFRAVSMLFGVCLLLTFGCKQVNSPFEATSENGQSIEGLNINVKYAESYDQTEITYSRLWPEGISAGLQKGNSSSNGELLVDYERTKEVLAFDEEGYMISTSEYIEGDGEMNMPEDAYNQLKSKMPARSSDFDPVIRTEMKEGKLSQYSKSGKLIGSYPVNKELYKIDPSLFDSLYAGNTTSNTDQLIKNNLQRFENSEVEFNRIGERYIEYKKKATRRDMQDGVDKEQYVLDLQNGNIILYATINSKGDFISLVRSHFNTINGFSVLVSEERLAFGEINQDWDVIERRRMTRENIQIIYN